MALRLPKSWLLHAGTRSPFTSPASSPPPAGFRRRPPRSSTNHPGAVSPQNRDGGHSAAITAGPTPGGGSRESARREGFPRSSHLRHRPRHPPQVTSGARAARLPRLLASWDFLSPSRPFMSNWFSPCEFRKRCTDTLRPHSSRSCARARGRWALVARALAGSAGSSSKCPEELAGEERAFAETLRPRAASQWLGSDPGHLGQGLPNFFDDRFPKNLGNLLPTPTAFIFIGLFICYK